MRRALVVLALGATAGLCVALAQDRDDDEQRLIRLYYDFEVAGYCAAVDSRVGRGFQVRSAQLVAQLGIDQDRVDALRGEAWQAAHGEWQNRGLGGFRAWCRADGVRAARRIRAFAPPDEGPG